jgi:hypothetical protein
MTTVSLPDIRCYIKPPNGVRTDYSQYLVYNGSGGSPSFSQSFGRQGTTGTIYLVDPNYASNSYRGGVDVLEVSPSFVIPTYSQVLIVDQSIATSSSASSFNNGVLFSGYVSDPALTLESANSAIWSLSVVDYSGYANASIVYGEYEGLAMDDLIVLLVKEANCGIKAKKIINGGFISPGPTLPRMVFPHTSLTSALQKVSSMASSTSAFGWFVDQNLNLHFLDQNQVSPSGITVTDKPTASSSLSLTEAHIKMDGSLKYDFDGTTLYNRAVVTGATTTVHPKLKSPPTNLFSANGSLSYNLSNIPDTRSTLPRIIVNGTASTISYNDGTSVPTTPWYIAQVPNGSWVLQVNTTVTSAPGSGTIQLWYPYQTQITAQADDNKSQISIGGPNNGIFAKSINSKVITTATGAYQRAVREITEYGRAQERIIFTTSEEWVGLWQAGQSFILNSQFLLDSQKITSAWPTGFAPGLNAKFVITQATLAFTDQGFRRWGITAVRVR